MKLRSGREKIGGAITWNGERYTIYSIYTATAPDGAVYVGCTIQDTKLRWDNHKIRARCGSSAPFHCALRKFGASAFAFAVVAQSQRFEDARALELELMAQLEREGVRLYNRARWRSGCRPAAELPWPEREAFA